MLHAQQRAMHLLWALLLGIVLLGLTPVSSFAASNASAQTIRDVHDYHRSGYHIVEPKRIITKIHGEWAIPCEYTSNRLFGSYGGHGTWVSIGGFGSPSVKVGSAVSLGNGYYSYLWYEGTNGVMHVLTTNLFCGGFPYVTPFAFIRATLYESQFTGLYRYNVIATNGRYGKELFSASGDIGIPGIHEASWADSLPYCNGKLGRFNDFGHIYWNNASVITSRLDFTHEHSFRLVDYPRVYKDTMYSGNTLLATPSGFNSDAGDPSQTFNNTWMNYGGGVYCYRGNTISF